MRRRAAAEAVRQRLHEEAREVQAMGEGGPADGQSSICTMSAPVHVEDLRTATRFARDSTSHRALSQAAASARDMS